MSQGLEGCPSPQPPSRPHTLSAPAAPALSSQPPPCTPWSFCPRPPPDPLAPHLVVVGTEVFEVSEADVAETDDNGDDQDHECEHGRGG